MALHEGVGREDNDCGAQTYSKQVNIDPWKYVKPVGAAVCVIVVMIYIYFS